jgi:hypothetical protein
MPSTSWLQIDPSTTVSVGPLVTALLVSVDGALRVFFAEAKRLPRGRRLS